MMAATLPFGVSLNGRKRGDVNERLYPGACRLRSSVQSLGLFFVCVVRVFGTSVGKGVKYREMQHHMVLLHIH